MPKKPSTPLKAQSNTRQNVSRVIGIYNVAITTDTEASQALPKNTKRLKIKCRTAVALRVAFVAGKVAGSVAPFYTIASGEELDLSDLLLSGVTVYVSAGSGVTAEIIALS